MLPMAHFHMRFYVHWKNGWFFFSPEMVVADGIKMCKFSINFSIYEKVIPHSVYLPMGWVLWNNNKKNSQDIFVAINVSKHWLWNNECPVKNVEGIKSPSNTPSLTNCFCKLAASPLTGLCPKVDNSVSLRITHSVNSRRDKSKAFQCSAFDSRRFLKWKEN